MLPIITVSNPMPPAFGVEVAPKWWIGHYCTRANVSFTRKVLQGPIPNCPKWHSDGFNPRGPMIQIAVSASIYGSFAHDHYMNDAPSLPNELEEAVSKAGFQHSGKVYRKDSSACVAGVVYVEGC